MKLKVCHLTAVHPRYDTRIFWKECISLQRNGFDVSLIVADNNQDEHIEGVKIFDVGRQSSRFQRIIKTPNKIYKKAVILDADVFHFHDPELIPVGLKLRKKGKKVIYDVHEDVPRQLLCKPYLNRFFKKIISMVFEIYENYAIKKFTLLLTATNHINKRLVKHNKKVTDIYNYPIISELATNEEWQNKDNEICYIGRISKTRGIREIVKSMEYIKNAHLNLAGEFDIESTGNEIKNYIGWEKVKYFGYITKRQIYSILKRSKIGLVTLYPIINYWDALPVKMFEYMAAGIPVIASNIPIWKNIIEGNRCGIIVDPFKVCEIADAINYLLNHPDKAEEMGKNGKKAIKEKYNWSIEEAKLIDVYYQI